MERSLTQALLTVSVAYWLACEVVCRMLLPVLDLLNGSNVGNCGITRIAELPPFTCSVNDIMISALKLTLVAGVLEQVQQERRYH